MITEVNCEDTIRWNEVVRSFSDYDVFYLNEYVTAFMKENAQNGVPVLLCYEADNERAINVLFKRDIAYDKHFNGKIPEGVLFDLITPYGYGGFWGDISDHKRLNEEYRNYCVERGYVCEFTRFELFSDSNKYYEGFVETRTHNIVRNLETPIDEIWMNFKQKVRKNVRRATQNNLHILIENTNDHLEEFLDIYYGTMERNSAESQYYFSRQFFEKLIEMRENIMFFHVIHNNKIISTELVIYGSENAYSYLGGTSKEYFELRPNDFLKYEIIKWAKEKGLKNFVLGGGYGADDGIYQYKLALAPDGIVNFYIGKRIFDFKAYDELCSISGVETHSAEMEKVSYFPEYRA